MAGLNLDKLKNEINSRKQDRGDEIVSLAGEGKATLPKDMMLHKIIEAAQTGRVNEAIIAIKTVDQNANIKSPLPEYNAMTADLSKHLITGNNAPIQQTMQQPLQPTYKPPVDITNKLEEEKELGLYAEIERRNSEQRKLNSNYPTTNPLAQNINNKGQQQMTTLNESALVESVEQRVLTNLNESLGAGIKEILKETVLELYTTAKIKDVIAENPQLIKNIILENKSFLKEIVIGILREMKAAQK